MAHLAYGDKQSAVWHTVVLVWLETLATEKVPC